MEQKIQYIVCKPVSEYMYSYGINSAKKLRNMEKGELKALIRANVGFDMYKKACTQIDRFNFFMVDLIENDVVEFDIDPYESRMDDIRILTASKQKKSSFLLTSSENFGKIFNKLKRGSR